MINRENRRQTFYMYLFISPWIIGFLVFALYPILSSLYFSFTDYDIIHPPKFIGLANYTEMFHNDLFWKSVVVTLRYTFIGVPIQLVLGLGFALLLHQTIPLRGFFRTAMYFPSMVSGVPCPCCGTDLQPADRALQLHPFLVRYSWTGLADEPRHCAICLDHHDLLDSRFRNDFIPRRSTRRTGKLDRSR